MKDFDRYFDHASRDFARTRRFVGIWVTVSVVTSLAFLGIIGWAIIALVRHVVGSP